MVKGGNYFKNKIGGMKKILTFLLISLSTSAVAQPQTFDITTYTAPKGWTKQATESTIQFSKEDAAKGTYCLITLYKSIPGTTNAKENFDLAWISIVKEMVTVSTTPEMQQPETENGWETQSGYAPFEANVNKGIAVLVTSTGYNKMVNLIILTNTDVYEKDMSNFLASLSLKKSATNTQQITGEPTRQTAATNATSILGTWCITASDQSSFRIKNGVMSTIYRQYTFKENGSYSCTIKTFDPLMSSILLGREAGTYQISGNNLTINPQKNILEEWSKKNNADQWGKLLKTQKTSLEKVTYHFTKVYIPENNEWQLILKAGQETKRDGPFNNYDKTEWIYIITSSARPVLKLPN
jgi:hypothetical protein